MEYRIEVLGTIDSPDDFVLENDSFGILDGDGLIVGDLYRDITPYVRSFNITRGRTNIFGFNSAGQLSVELNNFGREFDPTLTTAEFYGLVFPKRPVRVFIDDEVQFIGVIQDWNLVYQPAGVSIASFEALDVFAEWSGKTLPAYTPAAFNQTSEAIAEALEKIGVTDPQPDPAVGTVMTTKAVDAGTNALQYVQKLTSSDFGNFFTRKDGTWSYQSFESRFVGVVSARVGQGSDVPIAQATVEYGTENLFNTVTITFADNDTTVTDSDTDSINAYGEFVIQDSGSLITSSLGGAFGGLKATEVLSVYKDPELRINTIDIELSDLIPTAQESVLGLELGDKVIVAYDPDNSGRKILRMSRIIGIRHTASPQAHFVSFNFESASSTPFTLDDADLGRLDAGNFLQRTFDFSIGSFDLGGGTVVPPSGGTAVPPGEFVPAEPF